MTLHLIRDDRPTYDPWDGEPLGVEAVWVLTVDTDTFDYPTAAAGHAALDLAATARADGREVFPCGWIVEDSYPEGERYTRPCGALAVVDADGDGWRCDAGHWHRSGLEWFDDDEIAAGGPFPANAHTMEGRPL